MTKKRRMFGVDLPADDPAESGAPAPVVTPESAPVRRGPMATAIGETADTLRDRQRVEAEIRAENDALAHEFVRMKRLGLVTDLIAIDMVDAGKLVRDRSQRLDPEIAELKASIVAVGLSNPIRVEAVGQGRYELVQGWRRLAAYRALYDETGDEIWSRIPAALVPPGETVEGLYRRMVDENLVRKDISWAEMARLAVGYAEDGVGGCTDFDQAVNILYASANPQRRSYIRRFAYLMGRLEKHLEHPEAISRALGLDLAHRIEADPAIVAPLVRLLQAVPDRDAAAELAILRSVTEAAEPVDPAPKPARGRPARRGKTTLRLPLATGTVKCTATPGKVELQMDRDFSSVDRARLESAIEAFFAALD